MAERLGVPGDEDPEGGAEEPADATGDLQDAERGTAVLEMPPASSSER